MIDYNEYMEIAEKFKTVNIKEIPRPLLLQVTYAQIEAERYAKELEKHVNRTTELMKQIIVLDGINKSAK